MPLPSHNLCNEMHYNVNGTYSNSTWGSGEQDGLRPAAELEQNPINHLLKLKLSVLVIHKQPGFAYTFILQI